MTPTEIHARVSHPNFGSQWLRDINIDENLVTGTALVNLGNGPFMKPGKNVRRKTVSYPKSYIQEIDIEKGSEVSEC
jgi:hypothetical protein